jgi:CheY-like chemotaxis protein
MLLMTAGRRSPPLVMLVDDSVDQLELFELALQDSYAVRTAERGETAIALAVENPPDVILVDLQMPGMDGWEVCRRLKADPRTAAIPLIILSGHDASRLRGRAVGAGAAAVLTKPCSIETLRAEIDRVLG